jgi:hypothetical protein|tara:strand:+ start:280 stop:453 length:174 start_codon:yes stop_codon:yes gene_type:complete
MIKIKLKAVINIDVDSNEYFMPTDENVEEELESHIKDCIFDVDGVEIKYISITRRLK